MTRSCSILLFDFEKDLASVIDAAYTGDHSIKVFNPVTGKCTPHLSHGKGTRDGKSAHFFPSGVDCQTNNSVYSQLFYGLLKDGNRCFSCG